MENRTLGPLTVSALGLGCMGMSEFYGTGDEQESIATIHAFLDAGGSLLDTADMYGPFTNEKLVGGAISGRRADVVLATKFGNERREDGSWVGINGHPDYVRAACDASLQRLGVDHIDLCYQHRVDKTVPIEDTVGAMATCPRRASDHRPADRVLAVGTRTRDQSLSGARGTGDRFCALQPAGPRLPDRPDPLG